jgi:hypothetical protein
MILPLRSFEFADVRWASQNARPGRSSIGAKPSDANGLVLSPAEMYRLTAMSKYSEPAEWQQSAVWCENVRYRC